jgi:copper chaperone NosL
MIRRWRSLLAAVLLGLSASACDGGDQAAEAPPPAEYGGEATGYFCGMLLAEHGGPKGQVHLQSRETPLWFSSVRDTVAFTLLEGEPKDVLAIYVNDMGRAADWQAPEPDTWVTLAEAWFVIESRRLGGMGLPEVVPFGAAAAAESFAAEHGGRVVRLAEIPADYVLGMPDLPAEGGYPHGDH